MKAEYHFQPVQEQLLFPPLAAPSSVLDASHLSSQLDGVGQVSGGGTVPALPRALGAALGGSDKLGIKTLSCSSCRSCSLLV